MRVSAVVLATLLTSVNGFAPTPTQNGAVNTELFARKQAVKEAPAKKAPFSFNFGGPKAEAKPAAQKKGARRVVAKKGAAKKKAAEPAAKPAFSFFGNNNNNNVETKTVAKKTNGRSKAAPKVVSKKPSLPSIGISFGGKSQQPTRAATAKASKFAKKNDEAKKGGFNIGSVIGSALGQKEGTRVTTAIFEMDLWKPVSKSNEYGARRGKDIRQGKLAKNSYVPAGMSKAEYEKIRTTESRKKTDRYNKYAAVGEEYGDFQDFYAQRGTDSNAQWRGTTNGHTMCKTKYDWQGDGDLAGFGAGGRTYYNGARNEYAEAKKKNTRRTRK